jgi:hypothetical protein
MDREAPKERSIIPLRWLPSNRLQSDRRRGLVGTNRATRTGCSSAAGAQRMPASFSVLMLEKVAVEPGRGLEAIGARPEFFTIAGIGALSALILRFSRVRGRFGNRRPPHSGEHADKRWLTPKTLARLSMGIRGRSTATRVGFGSAIVS